MVNDADREAASLWLWAMDKESNDQLVEAFAAHRQYGYDSGYYAGSIAAQEHERKQIVAWLRNAFEPYPDAFDIAEEIAAGEHLK